jgi:hypothetical protein
MAAGKEIKRLRGSISAQKIADLIGISAEKLRKWEQRDADPKDIQDIRQIEWYFGCKLENLTNLDNFNFVQKEMPTEIQPPQQEDYQKKYIDLHEKYSLLLENALAAEREEKKALNRELSEFREEFRSFRKKVDINLDKFQVFAVARMGFLRAIHRSLAKLRAKVEKRDLEEVLQEHRKSVDEETEIVSSEMGKIGQIS